MAAARTVKRTAARFLWKSAANMASFRNVLEELLRNALFHGHAENVYVVVAADARGGKELHIIDDGDGMDRVGRFHFAFCLGNPNIGDAGADRETDKPGTGSGARLAASGLCQVIEAITVPSRERGKAYRTVLHLPTFIQDASGEVSVDADWTPVRREDTPFPASLSQGTMLILREFRVPDPNYPSDESRMRDTSWKVTEEGVRRDVPAALRSPDLARRVLVNGKRIQPPELVGYPLWSQRAKEAGSLGSVSGDIRYTEEAVAWPATIGGTTSTVFLRTFLEDLREHAPKLAATIPPELFNRQLVGHIRIGVLEGFPTQSREHLDPTFYGTDSAAAVVNLLVQEVAPHIRAKLAEYESRPATEQTRASAQRVLARLHQAQGIQPGRISGGDSDETGGSGGPRPEEQPLQVNRVTVRLEMVRSGAAIDTATFRVTNPVEGETFTWNDHGQRLIAIRSANGDRVEVRAVRKPNAYPINVQSDQYPNRQRTLSVDVFKPEDRPEGDEFYVVPSKTTMFVDDEKAIAVGSEGKTSGDFRWEVFRLRSGKWLRVDGILTVSQGNRRVVVKPKERGDYRVECRDARDPKLVATCEIEVHDQPRPELPTACGPGGSADGGGIGGGGSRPSPAGHDL
ncbi:MAG: ATP-binding protein, partial [bacterium]|nr:ATP-binding protein [bacterium]